MSIHHTDDGTAHHKSLFHWKHDGKALEALPMLFTFTPIEQEHQAHGVVGSFCQAGGHEGIFKANGPILEKQASERERDFYAAAAAGQWPAAFLPGYHGEVGEGSVALENLLHGLKCPCVMDLKMGTRTVEATEQRLLKKVKMSALDLVTRTAFTGVRLVGMSVHRALERGRVVTSKAQSHAIAAAAPLNLEDVMMFFLTDESGVRRDVAKRFLRSLRHILSHFETANDRYMFIGSSILLVYDNDNAAPHSRWARALERGTRLHPDTYATLRRKTRVDVRMIDFAHTGPLPHGQERDHGYITGLRTLISTLEHVIGSGSCPQRPIFSVAAAAADAALGATAVAATAGAPPTASTAAVTDGTDAGIPPGHAHPSPQPPQPTATLDPSSMHTHMPHYHMNATHYPTIPPPACSPQRDGAPARHHGQLPPEYPPRRPLGSADGPAEGSAAGVPHSAAFEPTFFSLLGVRPPEGAASGADPRPLGDVRYPELPALADGEGRWQWPGTADAGVDDDGGARPPAGAVGAEAVFGGAAARRDGPALPRPTV